MSTTMCAEAGPGAGGRGQGRGQAEQGGHVALPGSPHSILDNFQHVCKHITHVELFTIPQVFTIISQP